MYTSDICLSFDGATMVPVKHHTMPVEGGIHMG